jgi:hypothetical protein
MALTMLFLLSGLTGSFSFLDQLRESACIKHCQIGKHLTVDLNAGFPQAINKPAVFEIQRPAGGIDTLSPETAILALLLLAADICESHRPIHRHIGLADQFAAIATVALGLLQDFATAITGSWCTCYSHFLSPYCLVQTIGKTGFHPADLSLFDLSRLTQTTLTLGALLGKDVPDIGTVVHELTRTGLLESLSSRFPGFHLWHGSFPLGLRVWGCTARSQTGKNQPDGRWHRKIKTVPEPWRTRNG